jgi:hypothetical protein
MGLLQVWEQGCSVARGMRARVSAVAGDCFGVRSFHLEDKMFLRREGCYTPDFYDFRVGSEIFLFRTFYEFLTRVELLFYFSDLMVRFGYYEWAEFLRSPSRNLRSVWVCFSGIGLSGP